MTLRDIVLQKQKSKATSEPKIIYTSGIQVAIDYIGDASVFGRPGYVWIKESGQNSGVFQCYSPTVRHTANIPVIVAHQPTKPLKRRVIDVDWDKLSIVDQGEPFALPIHHTTHEWPTMKPGSDVVQVYPRAIVPFRVFPIYTKLSFAVGNSYYIYNGTMVQFTGLIEWDLTDSLPITVGNYRIVLVYLDASTNAIEVLEGTESADPLPEYPAPIAETLPLTYIRLAYGQTTLTEADIIDDVRPLFTFGSNVIDIVSIVNKYTATIEAEFDFVMTRHIVSGG